MTFKNNSKGLFKRYEYWRFIEPIMLGAISNIVVNYIFNPLNPDWILKEFFIAILLAIPITEANKLIGSRLEKKYSWHVNFKKRFLYQLLYLTVILLLTVNVVGNFYMWIVGDDFHSPKELLIINSAALIISFFLTFSHWFIYFYQNWKRTELKLQSSNKELRQIQQELQKGINQLQLQKGQSVLQIKMTDIEYVQSELGVVWVHFQNSKAVYNSTLTNLFDSLPKHLFFQANRNFIVKRNAIASYSTGTYGKVNLHLTNPSGEKGEITISRLKAAAFRKWYYSSSSIL